MLKTHRRGQELRYLCTTMRSKNTITLTLMMSSILLLVILQIFWLHNTYEKAYFDFRRQVSSIFRSTSFALRDTMLLKSMVAVPPDSVAGIIGERHKIERGFAKTFWKEEHRSAERVRIAEDHADIKLTISSDGDTIQKEILGPITARIATLQAKVPGAQRSFVIRLSPDTLNLDTLHHRFRQSLIQEGISADFSINHIEFKPDFEERIIPRMMEADAWPERTPAINVFSDTLQTDPVGINPIHRYTASVVGMRGNILKQISPQLLFSLFLTLITTASFIFMYRNIRMQQRLMDSKNDFISNVSHELKTPVATVSVALEALKNFNAIQNPKLTEEYLDIALRELSRLSGMTDKILNASLIEKHGLIFEQEDVNLNHVIKEMLISMRMVFEKRNAEVNYSTDGKDFNIQGSTLHLTNVLFNLVDNALKYSHGRPTIEISLQADSQKVTVMVKDRGVGIPSAYQRKIFEKFFRVPTGDVHNIKGYGLGLSYVASVIKSHGGTIDVESVLGEGSAFVITIPRMLSKVHRASFRLPISDSPSPTESA